MAKSLKAQLDDFTRKTARRMRYVAVNSFQDVMEAVQTPQPSVKRTGGTFEIGKIPVDEADLINSLIAGLNGHYGNAGPDAYVTALAGMEIGDTVHFTWTAPYARRIESGFTGTDSLGRSYNVAGRHFVGANAARFPQFVAKRESEVRG